MAPKRGKETPLELCSMTLSLGNSIAVHVLEYINEAKIPKPGTRELALEFLESARPLFFAKTGLQGLARDGVRLSGDVTDELAALLRQYNNAFVIMDQTVNKLVDNQKKHGFSKLGSGFRTMFAADEVERLRLSLVQCREAANKNPLMPAWSQQKIDSQAGASIGYTALAAVFGRTDPSVTPIKETSPALRQDLPSPPSSEHGNSIDAHISSHTSSGKVTTISHPLSSRSITADYMSEITVPSSVGLNEEQIYNQETEDEVPKHAVRVKYDPSAAPRVKPKSAGGTISAGSKGALLIAVQEQNHKSIERLLDCGVPADGGSECNLLRLAITNHDLDSVRLLLLFGATPDAKDKEGFTPLYAATETSFFLAAQLLLKYGADPNLCAGPGRESPFALSLSLGKAGFVQLYLRHGASPTKIMANGEIPFIQAVNKTTPADLIEWMLVYDADPNTKNSHGEVALFRAINSERLDLVHMLLEYGANSNLPGPKHMLWPAVHRPRILQLLLERGANVHRAPGVLELATSINEIDSVQVLLKHGADPNAKKDGIFTPLCTAIRDDREKLVDILLKSGADPNLKASEYPAFKCVTHHRTHLLPRLIAAGSDPHKPKGIIEECIAHNNEDALLYLLEEHKVDPNAANSAGRTALTTAIRKGDLRAIDILLAHGANPAVRGEEWPINMAVKHPEILSKLLPHISTSRIPKGALELAVQADQLESVKLLLAKGVDVEEKNGGVFSPLTTSIRENRKTIFHYLIDEAGANPNAPGEHLPIIKAIRRHRENDLSYVRHLVLNGADINLMYRGWNAVLQALDKGDTQTLRLLAELGTPDLNARDEDGNSVLEILREREMKEEERILLKGARTPPEIPVVHANDELREMVSASLPPNPNTSTSNLPAAVAAAREAVAARDSARDSSSTLTTTPKNLPTRLSARTSGTNLSSLPRHSSAATTLPHGYEAL